MAHNFRDLEVWKRAMAVAKKVYVITRQFPKEEKFGMTSQIQRAAVSIASNIAEGAGRGTNKDFVHFLSMALGSAFEVETQLIISKELCYVEENDDYKNIMEGLHSIQPQLNVLMKKYSDIEK
ncbi:MAG: four helix bundle protein [Paludibacteraceae bacterium]|nr:four helix bundle protein [Paludibacteraceae bacterium]